MADPRIPLDVFVDHPLPQATPADVELRRLLWSTVARVVPYPGLLGQQYDQLADALADAVAPVLARREREGVHIGYAEGQEDRASLRTERDQHRETVGAMRERIDRQLDDWDEGNARTRQAADQLRARLDGLMGGPR